MSLNKFTIQKSFAINAGAGSGKTYTLSRRYINAILGFDFFRESGFEETYYENLKPALIKQIVTITYTEAAALEMKERIFDLISKIIEIEILNEDDGDKESIKSAFKVLDIEQVTYVIETLQEALKQSSEAKISTIHSFCLNILKTNADIAKFDSSIDMIKDDERDSIINEAKFLILNNPSNKEIIEELSKYLNLYFLNTIFKMYSTSSTFRKEFNSFDENSLDERSLKFLILDLHKLPYVKDDYDLICERFDEEKLDPKYKEFLSKYIENFFNFNAVSWSDLLKEFNIKIQFNIKPFNQMKDIKENVENIKNFEKFTSVYTHIDKGKEILFYKKIEFLKSLMLQVKNLYDKKLKDLGKLDFDEIISKTHEIVKDTNQDVKYMMVDEFQDTNSMQYEIIKHSLNVDSNLFVVGDSKQSIYSFQGAEIEVFNDAINDTNYISSIEPMDINYRSEGGVLNNVNRIFDSLLKPNEEITLVKQNYEATPQALKVSKVSKNEQGSFSFLINSVDKNLEEEETNEYEQIAKLIANIKHGKLSQYEHIKELIDNKEKAIAILFDSSTKMLELKSYLIDNYNIECKVSASENFYHTKEINDIFNLLMALQFPNDKFYKAAAFRSNILRYTDNDIYEIIYNNKEVKELEELRELFNEKSLSEFILYIYEKYSLKELQNHFSDSEQKKSNLDKFLFNVLEHENINGNDCFNFLKQIEKNIYFSEAKENEAFFESDNLESIQLCTIHSTKGLSYPMVIIAGAQKDVYQQIQSDSIKSNSFIILNTNEKKLVTGFKVEKYEPLAFRLLKQIDKLKHLAEKKRLLYVALTRAEHDVVISGTIIKKKLTKKDPNINYKLIDTSYLGMISEGLGIEAENLFEKLLPNSIGNLEDIELERKDEIITNEAIELKPLIFEREVKAKSATQKKKSQSKENDATRMGTIIHKILELYWNKFESIEIDIIYEKFDIEEEIEKQQIKSSIEKFKSCDVYKLLINGVDHRFELEFNFKDNIGFIDLIYFNKEANGWVIIDFKTGKETKDKEEQYQEQLNFYDDVLSDIGMNIVDKKILWV